MVRQADRGAAEAERVDEDELAGKPRVLESDLECDPSAERRADNHSGTQAAIFDVALDEAREVRDGVARTRLFGAAISRQVGREDPVTRGCWLESVAPLHVAR